MLPYSVQEVTDKINEFLDQAETTTASACSPSSPPRCVLFATVEEALNKI